LKALSYSFPQTSHWAMPITLSLYRFGLPFPAPPNYPRAGPDKRRI
jgi:hypothetical protein